MCASFSINFRVHHERNAIPTSPILSQAQALAIVESDYRKNVPGYHEAYLHYNYYNFSREKYEDENYQSYLRSLGPGWSPSKINVDPSLLNLTLVFVHANGTIYSIDPQAHTFEKICNKPSADCVLGRAAEYARDRLVYEVGAFVVGSDGYDSDIHYIVDAETGKIVYHIPYFYPIPLPYRLVNYNNQTINDLRQQIGDARFGAAIEIEQNASEIAKNTMKGYSPSDVLVILNNNTDALAITWSNHDTIAHTVTSDDGFSNFQGDRFNSGMIGPGKDYIFVFIDEGAYQYHCSIHPWMKGSISIVPNYA